MQVVLLIYISALAAAVASTTAAAQPAPKEIAGTISMPGGRLVTLHTCAINGANIQCDFTFKSVVPHAVDFKYDSVFSTSRLIDDTHLEHSQVTGYFVVGNGKPSEAVTLVKDESVTVIQIFSGTSQQGTRVNVLFGADYFSTLLR